MKRLILILAIILLILSAYILYDNRFNPAIYNLINGIYKKEITLSPPGAFDADNAGASAEYKGGLIYYSPRGGLYSTGGWHDGIYLSNPRISASGNYLLAFDGGASKLALYNNYNKAIELDDSGTIINARVNSAGFLALMTKEPGYRGKVTVYNNRGNELYAVFSGEKYIVDADISPDGRRLIVCMLDAAGDKLVNNILIYKIGEREPVKTLSYEDIMFFCVKYNRDGSVILIGDKSAVGLNGDGVKKWEYQYEGTLQTYSISGNNSVALGLRQREQKIVILYSNGTAYTYSDSKMDLKAVDINQNGVVAVSVRSVLFLDKKGFYIKEREVSSDIKNLHISGNKMEAFLIYRGSYQKINLK